MKTGKKNDAIQNAIEALRVEESELTEEISVLQARIGTVRTAISSMQALMPQETPVSPIQIDAAKVSQPSEIGSAYANLPFSKALEKFMHTVQTPLTPGEIAKKLSEAGYTFTAKNVSTQVHVGLTRNDGKLYQKYDKKWLYKRD